MNDLLQTLDTVSRRIARYLSKGINEQDTKASLIQPVLRTLGWDVEDLDDVQREYKRRRQDKPVDFALFVLRSPCLFVEAKALGQNLDDRKWANQIMGYASVAGVEWVVLTDGDEYRLYNSHATVPIEEKLFRTVRVSEAGTNPSETLDLLSKERIQENEIEVLWKAHFVDRQVRTAVEQLFATDPDPDAGIVRLIRKRVHDLSAKDIKASLRRAQIQFDFPVEPFSAATTGSDAGDGAVKNKQPSKKRPDGQKSRRFVGVTLRDLIDAKLLRPPVKLVKQYKGVNLTAAILPDGIVEFQGKRYSSCSTAGDQARATVIGGKPHTDGWKFWKLTGENGKFIQLNEVRQQYLSLRT